VVAVRIVRRPVGQGRLQGVAAAHEPDPTLWADPLLLGSNAALFGVHLAVTPTSKVFFREPFAPAEEAASGRPRIYITWHRLNYLTMLVLNTLPRELRPTIVAHDGIASRAFSHHSCEWLGYEVFVFRRRSPVSAREQIANYMRVTRRSILDLPDSGGPYGVMKPGILEVARAANALIVPFAVDSKPTVTLGKKLRHVIPVPFSRIDVRRGPALDGSATVDDCQRALDALA
jgi:lysophospholipid acyltransferase (LPLAT)-like uncharacterized protein